MSDLTLRSSIRPLCWAGGWLGLALGGFFDGILLHQILQWHHLLSGLDGVRDIRLQVLADGIFHASMYLVAGAALCLLWRHRAAMAEAGSTRPMVASALAGFGIWHVMDAVLSHWVLGIHRIKMDAADPLLWDLLWLLVFGVIPMLIAWRLTRSSGGPGRRGGPQGPIALTLVVGLAGLAAGLPPSALSASSPAPAQTVVIFGPGIHAAQAFDTLSRVQARVLWADAAGGVWVVMLPDSSAPRPLIEHGALWVRSTAVAMGCVSWMQTRS